MQFEEKGWTWTTRLQTYRMSISRAILSASALVWVLLDGCDGRHPNQYKMIQNENAQLFQWLVYTRSQPRCLSFRDIFWGLFFTSELFLVIPVEVLYFMMFKLTLAQQLQVIRVNSGGIEWRVGLPHVHACMQWKHYKMQNLTAKWLLAHKLGFWFVKLTSSVHRPSKLPIGIWPSCGVLTWLLLARPLVSPQKVWWAEASVLELASKTYLRYQGGSGDCLEYLLRVNVQSWDGR